MSGVKKFMESLQKDKKKAMVAFVAVIVFLITIIAGILTASGGEETLEGQEGQQMSSLDIPVDTNTINKGRTYGGTNSGDDFFSSLDDTANIETTNEYSNQVSSVTHNVYHNTHNTHSSNHTSSHSNTSTSSNNTSMNNSSTSSDESSSERRRRVPDDGAGNMTYGSSKLFTAVVANGDKTVKSGSYVKIRVAEDISVGGVKVPRNSIITGVAAYQNERMNINVRTVKTGTQSKKVDWTIYDEDGNLGVAVPASVLNDIVRDGVDEAGSSVDVNAPVVGSVHVNLQKKNKEVSFVIRDGHRVYIKANK